MKRLAVIATHHKGGTVWMRRTFHHIAARLEIRFVRIRKDNIVPAKELVAPIIFCGRSDKFREYPNLLSNTSVRIFHLIRDPRDVVISGMHYHCTSKEAWLHTPSNIFGGESYQSQINSFPTDRGRYVFEMDNRASAILKMLDWLDDGRSDCFECKYEDLIQDVEMDLFTKAATHLGFSGNELDVCRTAFWRNSLFGGHASKKHAIEHVRSGETKQWMSVFDKPLAEEFASRFGDVLIRLGYEIDNSWIGKLPSISSKLDLPQ